MSNANFVGTALVIDLLHMEARSYDVALFRIPSDGYSSII